MELGTGARTGEEMGEERLQWSLAGGGRWLENLEGRHGCGGMGRSMWRALYSESRSFPQFKSGETSGVRGVKWPLGEKCPPPSFPFKLEPENDNWKTNSVPFTTHRMNAFFGGSRKLMPF